jgi:WD40 repeat protein
VLRKAVAKRPDDRYGSARALTRALEEVTLRVEGAEDLRPYPGLASFTEEDSEYFFGREAEVEALWGKLRRPHLLAIIGPSGAGKSSFLQAGLIPAAPEGWECLLCTPGSVPILTLGKALAPRLSGDPEILQKLVEFDDPDVAVEVVGRWRQRHVEALLIVDQFEVLFTLNPPEVQARFAELLGRLALEADVHVLLSLRDDFLMSCRHHEALVPIFSELTAMLPPTGAALRRALVQPALKCGYRFEDEALVDEMLAEVEGERGALPLLAFAVARLWERRDRDQGLLTRQAYEDIGGVGGALAQHAEATLDRIGRERQSIVRETFRNLVTAQGTRAAREMEELLSVFEHQDAARRVLRELIDARLLTSFEATGEGREDVEQHRLEIIHESLLSNWPRLVRWQAQDAEGALLHDQLLQAAQLWEERDRPTDLLWAGTSFREYELWRERYPGGLTSTEEAFAQAMVDQAARRRRHRRLTVAAAFALLLGVLGIIGTLWRQSETSRLEAVEEARRAEASKLFALGRLELERYPTAAVAYALASLERADDPNVRRFALEALSRAPTAMVRSSPAWLIAFSPNGRWLAVVTTYAPGVELWSKDGGPPRVLAAAEGLRFRSLLFSSDSSQLISAHRDNVVRFWSVPQGRMLRSVAFEGRTHCWLDDSGTHLITATLRGDRWLLQSWPLEGGRQDVLRDLEASRMPVTGGNWLAWPEGRELRVVPLERASRLPPRSLGRHDDEIQGLIFHPDGQRLLVLDGSAKMRLWSLESRGSPRALHDHGNVNGVSFDPAGTMLATASSDQTVLLQNLAGPPGADPIVLRRGEVVQSNEVALHPDGRWLATSDYKGVALWPLSGRYATVLRSPAGPEGGVIFAPDDSWVAGNSEGEGLWVWPLMAAAGAGRRLLLDEGTHSFINPPALHPSGHSLVAGTSRGEVLLVPMSGQPPRLLFRVGGGIYCVAIDRRGRLVAAAGGVRDPRDAVVRVHDLETGETQTLDPGDGKWIHDLAFTPEGDLVAASLGGLRRWRLDKARFETLRTDEVWSVAVSADGHHLLSAGGEIDTITGHLQVHDLHTGQVRQLASHGTSVASVAFGPAGEVIATGSADGIVRVGPFTGEAPHLLHGHQGLIWRVAVSHDGRHIGSAGNDATVRVWPMPDLSQRPLHTLPHDELLARLRTLTNVRAAPDEESPTGYRLRTDPFPGWETAPTW